MLNKKWLAIFMIMMMAAFGMFAEDEEEKDGEEEKSEFATGFFNFEEESVVTVTDGAFDGFETKVKTLEGGVNLNLADSIGLALSPFAGVSDVKFVVPSFDALDYPTFYFDEATVYTGLKLALAPIDMLGLEFALYNVDYFGEKACGDLKAAAGLGFGIGLNLGVEQAFLDFEIADAIEMTWAGCRTGYVEGTGTGVYDPITDTEIGADSRQAFRTHLYNDFTYGLRFNFFNFIKDTLNTGLYIDGELEIDADWGTNADDAEYTATEINNEFNIGLITNPIDWFEGYFGFIMKNKNQYAPESDVIPALDRTTLWSINNNKFGIKFGTTFTYKCVSFDLNWIGYVGNFTKAADLHDKDTDWADWGDNGPFSQEITFTVAVALE